jgi:hypothetical protein
MLPGVFQPTILTKRAKLRSSPFIRPMHPKTEIRPSPEAIGKILSAGWVGQLKIHGHRTQIHIPADSKQKVLAFNRHGQLHKKIIPPPLLSELRRIFAPESHWNVIDAEWIKTEDKLYVFDFIKQEGQLLHRYHFLERWKKLPRAFISPSIQILGIFTTLNQCLDALHRSEKTIEGLVFKSSSPGFADSSIIRCRKSVKAQS